MKTTKQNLKTETWEDRFENDKILNSVFGLLKVAESVSPKAAGGAEKAREYIKGFIRAEINRAIKSEIVEVLELLKITEFADKAKTEEYREAVDDCIKHTKQL